MLWMACRSREAFEYLIGEDVVADWKEWMRRYKEAKRYRERPYSYGYGYGGGGYGTGRHGGGARAGGGTFW